MSCEIYFRARNADDILVFNARIANTTWNLRGMIVESTGLEWRNEENNGLVQDVVPHIEKGLKELTDHPEKYKQYEPTNGWGTIGGCRRFFQDIIDAWNNLTPWAKDIVEFWIE